jgi:hypothetical protein
VTAAVPRERISPKLAPNIGLVALNLYAAYRVDDRLSVALPMGAPWYAAKAPRNPILSFRLTVKGAVDGLMQAGFAECVRKGSPWGRTFSLIRATAAIVAFLEFPVPSNDG